MDWSSLVGGLATIVAAAIAVLGVAITVRANRRAARRDRLAHIYAEALRAAEEYAEAPFVILRARKNPTEIAALAERISDVQARLKLSQALLRVSGDQDVTLAYDRLVAALRQTAGPRMTDAWAAKRVRSGRSVPLKHRWDRTEIDQRVEEVTALMRRRSR